MEEYIFTFLDEVYTFNTNSYNISSIGIERTELTQEFGDQDLKITVPLSIYPFSMFLYSSVLVNFNVQINVDGSPLFSGVLKDINMDVTTNKATLTFGIKYFYFNGEIPTRNFGTSCSFLFCDSNCGIMHSTYEYELQNPVFTDTTKLSIVCDNLPINLLAEYYTIGHIETDRGESAYISKINYDADLDKTIINLGTPILFDYTTLTIFAGCDKSLQACTNIFNNINNFGGFPFIPYKNPTTSGVL